ncbi:MAG: DNA repair protein RecO [Deltaproteobacteria bacterium]|nr:DNA repair protein RecO [Deltaproteobacteria bacterium]
MPSQDIVTTRGLILRTFPLREADLIVSVLTEKEGKLRAVAKGARKSKRRFLGGLDLFDCGTFEIHGPALADKLRTLHAFERALTFTPLREDFRSLALGSVMLELTDLLAHDGDPSAGEMLNPLARALRELCERKEVPKSASAVRYFLGALRIAGVDPLMNPNALSPAHLEIAEGALRAPERSTEALLRPLLRALIFYAQDTVGKRLQSAASLEEEVRPGR